MRTSFARRNLFDFLHVRKKEAAKVVRRRVTLPPSAVAPSVALAIPSETHQDYIHQLQGQVQAGGELSGNNRAEFEGSVFNHALFNQPVLNQPVLHQPTAPATVPVPADENSH